MARFLFKQKGKKKYFELPEDLHTQSYFFFLSKGMAVSFCHCSFGDLHVWVSVVSCCAVNNWVIASRAHPGCFQWRRMRVNSVRSVETVLIVCHSKMRTLHSINFLSWNKPKWSRIFLGHNRSVLCVNLQILKASRMPKKCT